MSEKSGCVKIKSSFFESLWLCVGFGFAVSFVSTGFAACPGDPHFNRRSVIHFSGGPHRPVYFHNLSTAQIEAMRHTLPHPGMMHNPGLTMGEHQFTSKCQIGGNKRSDQPDLCVWADSVQVWFACTKMNVYLSSNYRKGTCPYNVILDHENQHVAINTRVFNKYSALLRRALFAADIPTKANPLSVRSLEEGRLVISGRIGSILKTNNESFQQELIIENAKIDTMENYRRTQARCKGW